MVCPQHREGKWRLGRTEEQILSHIFPISRIATLRQEILNFQQKEKETMGAAWDRFSILTRSC
jgi:hypothetical protein